METIQKLIIFKQSKILKCIPQKKHTQFQMEVVACFQMPPSKHLLCILNDQQLTNCLTDALCRSKTRNVHVLLSMVLRLLLWQKYLCGNNSNAFQIDYSDSSEVRTLYALELTPLANPTSDDLTAEIHSTFHSLQHTDELLMVKMTKYLPSIETNAYHQNESAERSDYFHQILKTNRQFGCHSLESCSNQNAVFQRCFEHIMQEAQKLKHVYENSPNVNLGRFSSEISYISDLFHCLQNEIQ